MAWLIATDGELSGRRFPLDSPCLVGRGPLNHVVLDDPRISRQHAKVSPESGGHVVYDLNSANGTFVNDVPVKRKKLEASDVVRFGPFSFKFEATAPAAAAQVKPSPAFGNLLEVRTLTGAELTGNIVGSVDAGSVDVSSFAGLVEMEDAQRKLAVLYGFMQSIASTLETKELLDRIVQSLFDVFPAAELIAIYLAEPGSEHLVPRKAVRRDGAAAQVFTLMPQVHEEVVVKKRAILQAPVTMRKRASAGLSMHAPMIYRGAAPGVLFVKGDERGETTFTQRDLDLLNGLASIAAMSLQNARMYTESLKAQRLAQDMQLAQQIQKSFLPHQLPAVVGLDFVTEYQPAYSVGGDFYDLFWVDERRLGIFIGDVAGKGVSAALLMARITSDLRLAALAEASPADVVARVNKSVLERKQHEVFVTGIYLTLDVYTHEIVMANAGHLPPLVRRRGRGVIQPVEEGTGTAIGFFEEATYEQVSFTLEPGDTLVLCTDGVLEATDVHGVQFGVERFEGSIANGEWTARGVAERLLDDLRTHVGDAPQYDDLTLIVCSRV